MDPINEIKQKLDIVDVITTYVSLKKAGRNYKGVCPFHSEKTPSFMVSPELQMFKCFGCNQGGDIFKFIELIEGIDFPTALSQLAERANVKLEKQDYDPHSQLKNTIYNINDLTTKFYQYLLLNHALGQPGLEYIKKQRHLTDQIIKDFRIGYAPDSWDLLYKFLLKKGITAEDMVLAGVVTKKDNGTGYLDKFRGRVMFPLMAVGDKIVGFTGRTIFGKDPKYLNTSETLVFQKSMYLYALDKARVSIKREGAVFVEGQMDTISAHQAGFTNVVASSGTSLTENQLRILARYTQDLTFCFDSDFAGTNALYRGVEMAEKLNFNIKIAMVPKPYKDIDELINADKEAVKDMLKDAVPAYDFFLYNALRQNDKRTAIGKKTIMEDLVPIFSRITNQVVFEHYAKQLASELDLSDDTVYAMFKSGSVTESKLESSEGSVAAAGKVSVLDNPEAYLLALLLHSNLDITRKFLYKLHSEDFINPDILELFEVLKDHLQDNVKDLNINDVSVKLHTTSRELLSEIYLADLGSILEDAEDNTFDKEISSIVTRIKKDSARRQLKNLSERIRLAEMSKDSKQVAELTKQFEDLSKGLLV